MVYNDNMEEKYTDVIWDTIAGRIGSYLSERDMSFQDCADRINEYCTENEIDYSSTPQGIHQYLRTGKRETRITPAFISIFAQTFNVSADWIMGLSETMSIDVSDKSVSKALGISDPMTIKALVQALSTHRKDIISCTPLLEKVVQSEEFNKLFDGYKIWIESHLDYHYISDGNWGPPGMIKMMVEQTAMHDKNIDPKNITKDALRKTAARVVEDAYDLAFAKVMRNAWQAVEKIDVSEYYEQKEQRGKRK